MKQVCLEIMHKKGFRSNIIVRCFGESITWCKERMRKNTNAIVTTKDKKHIFKVFCDVTITKDDLFGEKNNMQPLEEGTTDEFWKVWRRHFLSAASPTTSPYFLIMINSPIYSWYILFVNERFFFHIQFTLVKIGQLINECHQIWTRLYLSVIILLCPHRILIFISNLRVTFAQCDIYPQSK